MNGIEKHLKNICLGAKSEEALRRSVSKLGFTEPFVKWSPGASFVMALTPERELVISGARKRSAVPPMKFETVYNGEMITCVGWFIPFYGKERLWRT